jgi:hypothetical protein
MHGVPGIAHSEMMFFASNPQVGTVKKNLSECACLGVESEEKMEKKLTSEQDNSILVSFNILIYMLAGMGK